MILTALLMLTQPVEAIPTTEPNERLIIVGTDGENYDACAAVGRVTGLNPRGDGFLSVRAGPTTKARRKDRLGNGQMLSLCDQHGDWIGVVYTKDEDGEIECGTGTPSAYVGAYRGPCRYGWVHKRYVEFLAG